MLDVRMFPPDLHILEHLLTIFLRIQLSSRLYLQILYSSWTCDSLSQVYFFYFSPILSFLYLH